MVPTWAGHSPQRPNITEKLLWICFQQEKHYNTATITKIDTKDKVSWSIKQNTIGRKSKSIFGKLCYLQRNCTILIAQQQTLQIFYLHNILGHNSQLYSKSLCFAIWAASDWKQRNTTVTQKYNSHPVLKSLNQHPKISLFAQLELTGKCRAWKTSSREEAQS